MQPEEFDFIDVFDQVEHEMLMKRKIGEWIHGKIMKSIENSKHSNNSREFAYSAK